MKPSDYNTFLRSAFIILICFGMNVFSLAGSGSDYTVYVFLSETCPVCQSSTLELKKLYEEYNKKNVDFVGLFPNESFSNEESINEFRNKYSIPFQLKQDKGRIFTKRFKATTTPEVFLVNNRNGEILYKGRIDNSFEAIEKRRKVVTEHYLGSALLNILTGKAAEPGETKPVGCYISKEKD